MRRALAAALALPAALVLAGEGRAQGLGEGRILAEVSQTFLADSNFRLDDPSAGTTYLADTRFGLGYLTETPEQSLGLGFDTGLRALWEAERDFDLTFASPTTARGDYRREWASGALDAGLRFRLTEVDADRPLADFIDPDTGEVVFPDDLDQVTRQVREYRYDANLGLALATDAPSSYEFNLVGTRFDYDQVTPDTTPRTNLRGNALWRLQATPVLAAALFGSYVYFDSENARDTLIQVGEIDAGVIYDPSPVLRIDFGVGYTQRSQRETRRGTRSTETDSGPAARFAVRYALDDVTFNAVLRYTDVTRGRPLTGELRAAYPLPRGRLTGRVFQRNTGSSLGNEVQITGAGLGLLHEINTVSSLELDLAAAYQVDQTAPFGDDVTRYDLTAVYSRAITETVSASLGYRFRAREEGPEEATSNAVFVTIGRSFETRP